MKKPTCVPKEFNFRTASRKRMKSGEHANASAPIASLSSKECQPWSKSVGRSRSQPANSAGAPLELTNPTSPKLATKSRASMSRAPPKSSAQLEMEAIEKYKQKMVAKRARKSSGVNILHRKSDQTEKRTLTMPESFKLACVNEHAKSKSKLEQKRAEEQVQANERRKFKASAMPVYPKRRPVQKSTKPLTTPRAPSFLERDENAKAVFEAKVAAEFEADQSKRNFTATTLPTTTFTKPTSKKNNSDFEPCKPNPFRLSTGMRSKQRMAFDLKIAVDAAKKEALEKAAQERMANESETQLEELRRNLVHKPLPLPVTTYAFTSSNVVVKPKPVTDPKTPHLVTKTRARYKENRA